MRNVLAIFITSKTHGQHLVTFDQGDYDLIKNYNWYLSKGARTFYAIANTVINGERTNVLMHRLIRSDSEFIDHINGNGLNNTRNNLRACTKQQNNMNARESKSNKTGFKGVYFDKSRGKYGARITFNYRGYHLGRYDNPIKAADAYNQAAIKYFGEFAKLNVI